MGLKVRKEMEERGVPGGALEEEEKKELEHRVLALWRPVPSTLHALHR